MLIQLSLAEQILYFAPRWTLVLGMFCILVAGGVIGHFAGLYRLKRFGHKDSARESEGHMVGAVLGLLSLLLGFTFALAVDRYDTRKSLVREVQSSISATYLMAQTFEEPHRSRISGILSTYVENRIALGQASQFSAMQELRKNSERIEMELWSASLAATEGLRDDVASQFLETSRQTIDVGAAWVSARRSHVPARIFAVLLVYMFFTATMLAFALSADQRVVATIMLYVLLTMSTMLIVDLDRPFSGAFAESQMPLQDVAATIRDYPPSRLSGSTVAPAPPGQPPGR